MGALGHKAPVTQCIHCSLHIPPAGGHHVYHFNNYAANPQAAVPYDLRMVMHTGGERTSELRIVFQCTDSNSVTITYPICGTYVMTDDAGSTSHGVPHEQDPGGSFQQQVQQAVSVSCAACSRCSGWDGGGSCAVPAVQIMSGRMLHP